MSASVLRFTLIEETALDKNLQPMRSSIISLYAGCDAITTWVASVKTYEEALNLIQPYKLMDLFCETMSEVELLEFEGVLNFHPEYYFYDEVLDWNDRNLPDEIGIMIRDDSGIGLGEIRPCFDEDYNYNIDMYQNRINLDAKDDEQIIEELGEGKMYWDKTEFLVDAINKILDFWSIERIDTVKNINKFNSIKECLEYFKNSKEKYIIYTTFDN